jgi:hypothetical protein
MYLTRNQAYRKVPWVRIPPSPPRSLGLCSVEALITCKPPTTRAVADGFAGQQEVGQTLYHRHSQLMRGESESGLALAAFLHIASVLPTHLKQRIGDLAQRAHAHRVHQHFKNIFVVNDRLAQTL